MSIKRARTMTEIKAPSSLVSRCRVLGRNTRLLAGTKSGEARTLCARSSFVVVRPTLRIPLWLLGSCHHLCGHLRFLPSPPETARFNDESDDKERHKLV